MKKYFLTAVFLALCLASFYPVKSDGICGGGGSSSGTTPATAFQPQAVASLVLNASGTNTVLNTSSGGQLIRINVNATGSTGITTTGGSTLAITVDGGSATTYTLTVTGSPDHYGSDIFNIRPFFCSSSSCFAAQNATQQSSVNSWYSEMNLSFKTSLLIQTTVTGFSSGALTVNAIWAKAVA